MSPNTRQLMYPDSVVRVLRGYTGSLGTLVYHHLDNIVCASAVEVVTMDIIQEAISKAHSDYNGDIEVEPDMETISSSVDDIESGRYQSIEGVIDGLRSKCA